MFSLRNLVLILVSLMGSVAVLAPSFAASPIGSVTLVHEYAYGTLEGGDKKGLFDRDDVHQKEVVETITDGALHLEFVDETTLRLGSSSRMILDTLVYDPNEKSGRMVINMVQGAFRFVSGRIKKDGVRILTPTLSIAIRGTDFTVAIAANGSTSVSVAEGEVEISPNAGGDAVSLTPGQIATVPTASTTVEISSGTSVSSDPGLSETGPGGGADGNNDGGGGGGSH